METLDEQCKNASCDCGSGSNVYVSSNSYPPEIVGPAYPVDLENEFILSTTGLDRGQYRLRFTVQAPAGSGPGQIFENRLIRLPLIQEGIDTGEYKRVWIYKLDSVPAIDTDPDLWEVTAIVRVLDNPVFLPVLIGSIAAAAVAGSVWISFGGAEKFRETTQSIFNTMLVLGAVGAGIYILSN